MRFLFTLPIEKVTLLTAIGGCATLTFGLYVKGSLSRRVKTQDYYIDSIQRLKKHAGAQHLLGQPIVDQRIDLGSEVDSHSGQFDAGFRVPVEGPKGNGLYYIKALCTEGEGQARKCTVERCELEVQSTTQLKPEQYHGKRLVVFDRIKHQAANLD